MLERLPPAAGIGARIRYTPPEMRLDLKLRGEHEIVLEIMRELSGAWAAVSYQEVLEHVLARARAPWWTWDGHRPSKGDPWSGRWPWGTP